MLLLLLLLLLIISYIVIIGNILDRFLFLNYLYGLLLNYLVWSICPVIIFLLLLLLTINVMMEMHLLLLKLIVINFLRLVLLLLLIILIILCDCILFLKSIYIIESSILLYLFYVMLAHFIKFICNLTIQFFRISY